MTMPDTISLALVGRAITYFGQIAVAYGLVGILSRLIPRARGRMWLWSAFLLCAWVGWLALLFAPLGAPRSGTLHWSYRLEQIPSSLKLWETWGLRFYVAVVLILLLVWGAKRLRLRALVSLSLAPSPEIAVLFRRLAKKMKVESCQILLVPELRSPSMAGWLRPYVFFPSDLVAQLERSELTHVLLHELIHVRRRDYVCEQLATLACRVVFFHPAVWLAHRRLRRERELACDQTMGGQLACRRLRYAECLMRLAKWWFLADRYSVEGIGVTSAASFLATRVQILLEEPRRRSHSEIWLRAAVSTAMAIAGAYGLMSSSLSFYQLDSRQIEARALPHSALSRPRHLHSASAHTHPSIEAPLATDPASNDLLEPDEAQIENSESEAEPSDSAVPSLTPSPELAPPKDSLSAASGEPGFQGESKPNWNDGSIERSPLSRPRPAGVAATAAKVAIGVALAIGDDDFVGGR